MPKSLEQRLTYLEKVIKDFFSGTERSAKKVTGTVKRKAKAARKPAARTVQGRKAPKRRRSA